MSEKERRVQERSLLVEPIGGKTHAVVFPMDGNTARNTELFCSGHCYMPVDSIRLAQIPQMNAGDP